MTPPDSDAVCSECGAKKGPWYPYCTKAGDFGVHVSVPDVRRDPDTLISIKRGLAQRILALVEDVGDMALAAELRERLPHPDQRKGTK